MNRKTGQQVNRLTGKQENRKTIPYATQWVDEEDIQAVAEVLRSSWLTQGPKVEEFEEKVASYCGAKYAVAVSSGTAALHIACLAAGIGSGLPVDQFASFPVEINRPTGQQENRKTEKDEVITSPITFVASANCVLYCGGKPVFADVQEDTINIDPKEIEKKITPKTKAIIPVHFAGHPADLEEIWAIAKKHNLIVIEDAAHALGAEYTVNQFTGLPVDQLTSQQANRPTGKQENREMKWIKIGSCQHSDMTILSFHAVKHVTTGEGGMVLTNNKEYYEKLLMFRTHGITRDVNQFTGLPVDQLTSQQENSPTGQQSNSPTGQQANRQTGKQHNFGEWYYEMHYLGYNYRITDFQCALGIKQLEKLDRFIKRRREIVKLYNEAFKNVDAIICPTEREYVKSSWHLYPIRVKKDRKKVFQALRGKGIGVNVHYIPVYLQPYYRSLGYKVGDCPKAEVYYQQAITLPMFPKLSDEEVGFVIEKVKEVLGELQ